MTVNEYIEAVKQAHIDCGLPIPDAHAMAMVVDAWHKATKEATRAERERWLPVRDALDKLCATYLANRGTEHEFVSCITPKGIPDYWREAEAALSAAAIREAAAE